MKKNSRRYLDRTFWKFLAVGIMNTLVGTGIMFVFYNVFHLGYWISSASNYIFGSILSYILNRIFTFQSKTATSKTLPRFILNIGLCYLLAYGLAKPFAAYILSDYTQKIQENISMLIAMFLFVGLNYIGQRFFVFNKAKTAT